MAFRGPSLMPQETFGPMASRSSSYTTSGGSINWPVHVHDNGFLGWCRLRIYGPDYTKSVEISQQLYEHTKP